MKIEADKYLAPPLPHSPEAERAFLGGILLGAPSSELDRLDAADFFTSAHRIIFAHMKQLRDAGQPPDDVVILWESLSQNEAVKEAGGAGFISQLPDGLPRTSNLAKYAEIIKSKSEIRKRLHFYSARLEKLGASNGNAAELLVEDALENSFHVSLRNVVDTKRMCFKTAADAPDQERTKWTVQGLVPAGAIVSINAKIKLGKTALVLAMARAVIEGQHFLGEPTSKTNVVYLTEQTASSFDRALGIAGLSGLAGFTYLPFTETCGIDWPKVAEIVAQRCKETGSGVLVVDTLSQFAGIAGDSENDAGAALAAMLPLQKIAAMGIAVVIVRHARKSGGDVEDAGRGSSAFDGAADLILSLRKPEGSHPENRRLLTSSGRYSGETPNNLLIEMTQDGFVAIGSQQETVLKDAKETVLAIAPHSELEAATIAELVEESKVAKVTVHRACDELFQAGKLHRSGKGKRGSPYQFWKEEFDSSQPHSGVENETNRIFEREPGDEVEQWPA